MLSQMFALTPSSSDPTYLVVSALDRQEYPEGSTGATGQFVGNGHTLGFSSQGSDGYGADIVFTYQPSTGLYYSSTYGYFNQLAYDSSSSPYDVTNISVYATNSLASVTADAGNAWTLMDNAGPAYVGSATVATEPGYTAAVPTQATPDSIAAAAKGFVGDAWNMNGCWILASTIAAEAGTSLPVQSTEVGLPGMANGEWIVAFNGPAGQSGNWQSMVTAGEMIVFLTAGGTGHVTTCVSGSGSTAEVVDNVTYVNASGTVMNAANDGSSQDVTIASPHAASQEFAGVAASNVVIYELDTPVISDNEASAALNPGATLTLGSLFSVSDPAGKAVTDWQVYDTAGADSLSSGGKTVSAHTAANALTVSSLAQVALAAGSSTTADTLDVRAFNGSYWGDWQTLAVSVTGVSPPLLEEQTATQSWTEGSRVALALPAGTFKDPQDETLTYTAAQSNGAALPGWLSFNPATQTFSGTAPATVGALSLTVTATDSSGLSATDTFTATVVAPPKHGITLTEQTGNQGWTDAQDVAFILPANTFTDADGLKMTFAAYQTSGPRASSWLYFNPATDELLGVVPRTASGTIGVEVIAADRLGYAATDLFSVTLGAATTQHAVAGMVAGPAGNIASTPLERPLMGLLHG